MTATRWLWVGVGAVLIVVLGIGIAVTGPFASAQEVFQARDGEAEGRRGWFRHGPWGGGPDPDRVLEFRAELAEDLAGQLDAAPGDVEQAFRGVVAQRLDEAVADGRIDRSQADEALAAYDDGELHDLLRALKGGGWGRD